MEQKLQVGIITATHGPKGEVKVYPTTDDPGRFRRLKKVILDGDQYRLVSPYDGNHMSVMYAAPDKNKAVLYTYDIHPRFGEKLLPVKLQGLDAKKMYKVKEINLMPNSKSNLAANEKTYSGDYLMKVGINAFTTNQAFSRVIELTAE